MFKLGSIDDRAKTTHNIILQGRVQNVWSDLNYFELLSNLGETLRLYTNCDDFPVAGDQVTIHNASKGPNFYLILPETECEFPQKNEVKAGSNLRQFFAISPPLEIIEEYEFLDKLIAYFQPYVPNKAPDLYIFIKFVYESHRKYDKIHTLTPRQQKHITLPKDLRKTNNDSELYKGFVDFYPMGHMIQQYPSNCHLLGRITMSEKHHSLILEDESFWVFIKFTQPGTHDMAFYKDTVVLIEDYILIVENYEDPLRPTMSYILINNENFVTVIFRNNTLNPTYRGLNEPVKELKHVVNYMFVNRTAQTIIAYQNLGYQCWLDVTMWKHGYWGKVYLICPKEMCQAAALLEEGHFYKIYSETSMKSDRIIFYKELKMQGDSNQEVRILDPKSIFKKIDCQDEELHGDTAALTLHHRHHCKTFKDLGWFLKNINPKVMFDVTLKIARREINNSDMDLWCPRRHNREPFFGTGSSMQEKLTFKGDKYDEWPVDMFLCNQDNQVCHVGMVPGATLKITNVSVQKQKYLRTSIFTRMHFIHYEHPNYCSANLLFTDFSCWRWLERQDRTSEQNLYDFNNIPVNTIVYAQVIVKLLTRFSILGGADNFKMTLEVQQDRPSFLIETSDINLLADLGGLPSTPHPPRSPHVRHSQAVNSMRSHARKSLYSYCRKRTWRGPIKVFYESSRRYDAEINEPRRVFTDLINLITDYFNYNVNPLLEVLLLRQNDKHEIPYRILKHRLHSII